MKHRIVRLSLALGVSAITASSPFAPAASAGIPAYSLVGTFDLPTGASAFDVLPDGRVIAIIGDDIVRQSAISGSAYEPLGSLPAGTVSSFGASFLRLSPDGSTLAVGNNTFGDGNAVHTLALAALNTGAPTPTTSWSIPNTEAHWTDNDTLFVSGFGAQAIVSEIDLAGATARTVIADIAGASGGITTDGTYLYTSNGFDFGPGGSDVGEVRAFRLSDIASLAAGDALSFETQGRAVADALSGASLGFDSLGNLLVGGGDFFGSGDVGYAAIVDADAVAAALGGGPIAPDSAELRLTPRLATDSYSLRFSPATGELLITFFDNTTFAAGTTVYRYQVPAPGILIFSGVWFAFASKRRRAS